jgi:hypothetical protein
MQRGGAENAGEMVKKKSIPHQRLAVKEMLWSNRGGEEKKQGRRGGHCLQVAFFTTDEERTTSGDVNEQKRR